MPTLLERKRERDERYQRLIAFILPALAFYFGFVAQGLWPFGNKHLLAYDLYHQYAPFLRELRRKLLSGESLFFSWSGGLGVDFYSILTYYAASPFNLLTLLFPDRFLTEAVSCITLLKIAFSSLFFREFLTGAFRKRDSSASLFAAFYALSAWVYAYSWNIMWLDTLVFFPLACLGLVELVRDGKARRYVFALTLMLVTNYYAAFFACVFLLLYYFVVRVQFPPQVKRAYDGLVSLGRFAAYSLLSALLSAVVLWPTARALTLTSAAGDLFPSGFTFNQPLVDILYQMTPLRSPQIMSGLPNIFAGFFVLLLVPAFFGNRARSLRTRVAYGLLLGFLIFSFQSRTLSFLWHGAHYPNSLDYRYAFVFVALVLTMAYQAAGDDLSRRRTSLLVTAVAVFLLLLVEQQALEGETLSHWRLLTTIILTLVYLIIFHRLSPGRDQALGPFPQKDLAYALTGRHQVSPRARLIPFLKRERKRAVEADAGDRQRKINYRLAQNALFLFLAVELLFHAFTGAVLYQQVAPLGDRQYYTDNVSAREVYGYTKDLRKEYKGKAWRAEILSGTCVNDPILYGSNGMSLFASPFPQASIDYFSELGYPTNGVNSFQYKESTIVMDSLLSISYLIHTEKRIFDDRTRSELASGQETRLMKNEDALPFGFFATPEAAYLNDEIMPEDGPDVQNRLLSALSGAPAALVKEAFEPWEMEGCYVEYAYGDPFVFQVYREAASGEWAFLVYEVPEDGIYYIFWEDETAGINYSNGFIRDQEFFQLGSNKRGIGDLGFLEAGSQLHFRVSLASDQEVDGTFRACVARLDQEAWQEARQRLAEHPLDLDHFSATSFSGSLTAPRDGYLFLPTTGNPGWTFTVDGVKTEADSLRGSFILLPVSQGPHQITARFLPVGFTQGLAATLAGILITAGLHVYRRRRRRKGPAD